MNETNRRCAVFLDRDGIINTLVERDGILSSPRRAADFRVFAGVSDAVARLREAGFLVFVVSNQPDVARGRMAPAELESMMDALRAAVRLDDLRVCLHDDKDGCACRKPKPGMLLDLAAQWNVDLAGSYMVGDSWKDIEAGHGAGCRTVFVGQLDSRCVPSDGLAISLPDAVAQILAGVLR